ncbi:MAG: AAA-like domain-containing protein [Caldilineaceae bacterium]|nr:AAA-like domain-containing protein [Caldilineaceae bacterium]MCB0122620.1 AAA-like domain-containing protein [Caldilineaceae bacterium]
MAQPNTLPFDVFISYAEVDRAWVTETLLPALAASGLRICQPEHDFELGRPKLINTEEAIDNSRHTLVVLTPAWLESAGQEFESLLVQTMDPAGRQRKLIPLLLEPCTPPPRIAALTHADFTDPTQRQAQLKRLLHALGRRARIFISYKRNTQLDEPLALRLQTALEAAGHHIYIDQKITVGVEWAQEINRQIAASDYLIVLLSAASVESEMVAAEVAYAHRHFQQTGKARLLPVRVNFGDELPYQLSPYLSTLQYVSWQTMNDDEPLVQKLLNAIRELADLPSTTTTSTREPSDRSFTAPKPYADPRFLETLYEPGGAVRARSDFYIERDSDSLLRRELAKVHGTTTTIRAPRQTGKSSLLVRGIAQARQQRSKVVYLDLQPMDERNLQNLETFLHYFATYIVTQLRLDPTEVDKAWRGALGAPDKTTYLFEDYILPTVNAPIVLALDEVDRLLSAPFQDTFFGLLRYWHNSRALNELWEQLDLVLVISTEPHLLIKDVTQSPFNVGQKIRLDDFDSGQVQELNAHYRSPLAANHVADFLNFLGGHPFLTHKALYTMVTEDVEWLTLKNALVDGGHSFGDHLRRYLWHLRDEPTLRDALRQIMRHGECVDESIFYRLLQAGLIKGSSRQSCTLRCGLYADYFKDKL